RAALGRRRTHAQHRMARRARARPRHRLARRAVPHAGPAARRARHRRLRGEPGERGGRGAPGPPGRPHARPRRTRRQPRRIAPRAAGPGTFAGELSTAAGGRNAFGDAGARWPEVSLEEVVRRQPDVVVVAAGGADARTLARFESAPGWRDLRAVRAGRVVAVDTDLFNRPGPGLARAVVQLAAILHPDLFPPEPTP